MNQDNRVAGMALKVGSDSFNASLQGSYQRIQIENISNIDKVRKVAFGIEYKLAAGTWLVGTFGGESGRVNGENKSFVNAGLKFDLSKKSLFSPNPAN